MSEDLVKLLFEEVKSMRADLSDVKVNIASIKATDQEKEKRCDIHEDRQCKVECRVGALETKQASGEGSKETSGDWIARALVVIGFIVSYFKH